MRAHSVRKSRKPPGKCGKCQKKIKKGQPYFWTKAKYGPKIARCYLHPFKRSDLTSSSHLSRLYAAQETIEEAMKLDFTSTAEVVAVLEAAAEEAKEVAEDYRESANNIADGFRSRTSVCEAIDDKANSCDSWAENLEGVAGGLDEPPEEDSDDKGDDMEEEGEEGKMELWREDIRSAVEDAVGSLEL